MFKLSFPSSNSYEETWFHHHSNVTSLSGHSKTEPFHPCACYSMKQLSCISRNGGFEAWLSNWPVTVKLKLLSGRNIKFTVLSF